MSKQSGQIRMNGFFTPVHSNESLLGERCALDSRWFEKIRLFMSRYLTSSSGGEVIEHGIENKLKDKKVD